MAAKHEFIPSSEDGHHVIDGPIRRLMFSEKAISDVWPPKYAASLRSAFGQTRQSR